MVEADPEASGPFKAKMDSFFREATTELTNEQEALLEAKNKFKAVMQFYQHTPKGATLDTADPNAFFVLWLAFCKDFKVSHVARGDPIVNDESNFILGVFYLQDIWKKEQQRIRKERMKEVRQTFESKKKVETIKLRPTGLKARLQKLSRK